MLVRGECYFNPTIDQLFSHESDTLMRVHAMSNERLANHETTDCENQENI
jgi:hypothetical protein